MTIFTAGLLLIALFNAILAYGALQIWRIHRKFKKMIECHSMEKDELESVLTRHQVKTERAIIHSRDKIIDCYLSDKLKLDQTQNSDMKAFLKDLENSLDKKDQKLICDVVKLLDIQHGKVEKSFLIALEKQKAYYENKLNSLLADKVNAARDERLSEAFSFRKAMMKGSVDE